MAAVKFSYRAFLAVSTRTLNASGSAMASSLRALRFISKTDFYRKKKKRLELEP